MIASALQDSAPEDYHALLQAVVQDPGISHALRNRVQEDLKRDPVDALKDAELLQHVMQLRFEHLVNGALPATAQAKVSAPPV